MRIIGIIIINFDEMVECDVCNWLCPGKSLRLRRVRLGTWESKLALPFGRPLDSELFRDSDSYTTHDIFCVRIHALTWIFAVGACEKITWREAKPW
jgi:hypothetical protein